MSRVTFSFPYTERVSIVARQTQAERGTVSTPPKCPKSWAQKATVLDGILC